MEPEINLSIVPAAAGERHRNSASAWPRPSRTFLEQLDKLGDFSSAISHLFQRGGQKVVQSGFRASTCKGKCEAFDGGESSAGVSSFKLPQATQPPSVAVPFRALQEKLLSQISKATNLCGRASQPSLRGGPAIAEERLAIPTTG